jgi:hypothetical protein
MYGTKTLCVGLGVLAVSLATSPTALAWPSCSHPAVAGDGTTRYQTAVQQAIREQRLPPRDFAAGAQKSLGAPDGSDRDTRDDRDRRVRVLDGLLPQTPRWRM